MKFIEDIQELDPDPKHAQTHSMNRPLAGNRETPKGREDHAMKKKAIREAVQKKLRG